MYNVSIMIPMSIEVEADSFEEAIEIAFNELDTDNYGGDGIYVTDLETGETYEE